MTRLTIAATGDDLTFRPVTSSLVRESKDGNVNVILLLYGSHYNIPMTGILQQDTNADVEPSTVSIGTSNSFLELKVEQAAAQSGTADLIGTFSSFMYFYPGLKIRGHLKLDETSHGLPVPELSGHYHLTDLLSNDEIKFHVIRNQNEVRFECVEVIDTVETTLYGENFAAGVDEVYFEFVYLENGKSKLYTYANYATVNQVKTRVWIGDINAKIGECNVTVHAHNAEKVLHTVSSDFFFIDYPQLFVKFDRQNSDRFVGQIKMFDDKNDPVEANWKQIRSRDYKFIGNRIIENGMIRIIINTNNPTVEIWGWNYNAAVPAWEKVMTMFTESDSGASPLRIQNISFEYFGRAQIKFDVNFGTSFYSIVMSRGDPYITILNIAKTKFKFESTKDRFVTDLDRGYYNRANTVTEGSPVIRGNLTETIYPGVSGGFTWTGYTSTGFTHGEGELFDNWMAMYNVNADNEVVGWISNIVKPTKIDILDKTGSLEYTVTYPTKGNVFGIGVLPSYPNNLVNGIPFPFVVGTQDKYVKWRANEAVLSFKEIEVIKRR